MAETRKPQDTAPTQNEMQERKLTASERFAMNVTTLFEAESGSPLAFSQYERQLVQHLFLFIDSSLKELESKRTGQNRPPYVLENVNARKLALDAVHRIRLGLDGLIRGHLYVIPYLNDATKQYDLDLRIGYRGKDYYRRNAAVERPKDIRYELVYDSDVFVPKKKDFRNDIEGYEFEITKPFARGEIIGGFAYLMYDDPSKNQLVLVPESEFVKSQGIAKSSDFWTKFPTEMRYKTLVHRATDHLSVDPRKVNAASYAYVEAQDEGEEGRADRTAATYANRVDMTIDGEFAEETEPIPPPKQAVPPPPPSRTEAQQYQSTAHTSTPPTTQATPPPPMFEMDITDCFQMTMGSANFSHT